jgi:hypothetical protein
MNLVKWDPFRELEGIQTRLNHLFGDTPRALAKSPDGGTVYAAVFHSGAVQSSLPCWPRCTSAG